MVCRLELRIYNLNLVKVCATLIEMKKELELN